LTERVEELLDQYLDLRLGGEGVEIEGLLAGHPELAEAERERLRRLAGLLGRQANGSAGETEPARPLGDVGPYHVLRELGRGGQGAVYLAEDTRFARRVALKVLNRAGLELGDDPHGRDSAARLKREAEVVSRLDHPGICVVYEMGATEEVHYIAMRYVEGETLAKKVATARAGEEPFGKMAARHGRRLDLAAVGEGTVGAGTPPSTGRRSIERILVLVEQSARALHVAHEAGVVHRDVKPGNIMVTPQGEPVLLDFGLARDLEHGTATLTASGGLLGTPAYMSPEQFSPSRGPVDRRADVYALGVTLYECLTLRRPFEAATREQLYRRILTEQPSRAGRLDASIPRDLEIVLETAMEKDVDHRYQTALDLAEDLRRVRAHEPIRARPAGIVLRFTRWIQRNPVPGAALGGVFLALAAGLAVSLHLLGRERAALGRERASLVKSKGNLLIAESRAVLPTNPCLALLLAIEGAPAAPGLNANNVLLQAIGELRERRMIEAHPQMGQYDASPDGRVFVTTSRDGTARVFDADSWERIADLQGFPGGGNWAIFSPDGRHFAMSGNDWTCGVWSTSTWSRVHTLREPHQWVGACEFDPSGQRLLILSSDLVGETLSLWDVEREVSLTLEEGREQAFDRARFDPRGRAALLTLGRGVKVWDVGSGMPRVLHEVQNQTPGDLVNAVFSPDGSRMLVGFGHGEAGLWDVDSGMKLQSLDSKGDGPGKLLFRADGQRMLVGHMNGATGVWDAVSGKRVCELSGVWEDATFSADGARILTWGEERTAKLWDAGTAQELAVFAGHDARILSARFSCSDSTVITASSDGTVREWNVDSEAQRTTYSTRSGPAHACIDPAGKRIAIATSTRVLQWVQVIDLDSPARSHGFLVPGNDTFQSLAFAADGRSILTSAINHQPPEDAACTWDVETGTRLACFRHPPAVQVYDAEFSPDGRLVVTAGDDGKARIFDVRTGELVRELVGHTGGVRTATFGLGGKRVITASEALVDRTVRIWDADTGVLLTTLRAEGERPTYACLSPDGRRALAGCWDGVAILWDVSSGEFRRRQVHPGALFSAAFSPDGKRILTASANPGARLLDAETLDEVLTIDAPGMRNVSASFSPDGRWVVTASEAGTVRLWPADPLQPARELAPRKLTAAEREQYGLAPEQP
jgi:WD40 repeat protein/serine/threonine protein kinase